VERRDTADDDDIAAIEWRIGGQRRTQCRRRELPAALCPNRDNCDRRPHGFTIWAWPCFHCTPNSVRVFCRPDHGSLGDRLGTKEDRREGEQGDRDTSYTGAPGNDREQTNRCRKHRDGYPGTVVTRPNSTGEEDAAARQEDRREYARACYRTGNRAREGQGRIME